jgi:predicted O-methyltransferase YrrM
VSVLDRYVNGWQSDGKLYTFLKSLSNIEIGGDRLYDGTGIHFMQNPKEFHDLLQFLVKAKFDCNLRIDRILEFGWSAGISHTIFYKILQPMESVVVDLIVPSGINTGTFFANLRFKNLTLIANDSTSNYTKQNLSKLGPYDFIFIDGGHDYETVKLDFLTAKQNASARAVIAVHDIYAELPSEVKKFWEEVKLSKEFKTIEFCDNEETIKYGIGLVSIGSDDIFNESDTQGYFCKIH